MGRAERDAGTARTVNISSRLVLLHGARHGFGDSGARPASSPPAFYYYWFNITQAPLIIHHHLSAKSHAEEPRRPAAWRETKTASLRFTASLVSSAPAELWALIINSPHEDGVLKIYTICHASAFAKRATSRVRLARDRVPPVIKSTTVKEIWLSDV